MSRNEEDLAIPDDVRAMAEDNVAQARSAYRQFAEVSQLAHDIAARSCGELAASTVEIQAHAFLLADANIKSGFEAAARLASARDLGDLLSIHSDYLAQQLAQANQQTRELGQMVADALDRSGAAKSGPAKP